MTGSISPESLAQVAGTLALFAPEYPVCAQDLIMVSKTSFSREEFNDQAHIILNILNQRLAKLPQESDVVSIAQAHGLHRWQCGYSLPALLVELEHLFRVVVGLISEYHQNVHKLLADVILEVHAHVLDISQEAGRGSVPYFDGLDKRMLLSRLA